MGTCTSPLGMTISQYPSRIHVLYPSIPRPISISLGASSIAHTPYHSISHPCTPITISRGSLWQTYTLSSPCLHFLRMSLSTSLPCLSDPSWPRARGLALSVPNNHTLSPHLASVVEDACVICLHKTRTLFLYFYRVLSMSLSHTHTHFFHSLFLFLSISLSS